jgi:hypothetical protein
MVATAFRAAWKNCGKEFRQNLNPWFYSSFNLLALEIGI